MSNTFSYSVLKYSHSKFLGEELNVGVLFVFPEEKRIQFHRPKKLSRLTNAYPGLPDALIRGYLNGFAKQVKGLFKFLDQYAFDLNDLISDFFLVEDASALHFDKFRHAVFYTNSDAVIKQYTELLLGPYQSETASAVNLTDRDVILECKKIIIHKRPEIEPFLKFDESRVLRNNRVTFKSDFYWQNGTTNFVKAVSFDLKKEEGIIEKSLLINSQLRQLELSKVLTNSARIDLILHQPSDPKFAGAYQEAVAIIDQIEINKILIPDSELDSYTSKVVAEIEMD